MTKTDGFYNAVTARRERVEAIRAARDAFEKSGASVSESVVLGADMPVRPGQRLVFGLASEEICDDEGESPRLADSMPFVIDWALKNNRADATTFGPLCVNHKRGERRGRIQYLKYDCAARTLLIGAQVDDAKTWSRIGSGEMQGLSIGGEMCFKTRHDVDPHGKDVTSYVWLPYEISLGRSPMVPTARLDAIYTVDKTSTIRGVLKDLADNTEVFGKWLSSATLQKLTRARAK